MIKESFLSKVLRNAIDGFFYGLLSSVFSFVFIVTYFSGINEDIIPHVLIFNLIFWQLFSFANISKKTFLISLSIPVAIFIVFSVLLGLNSIISNSFDFYYFIFNNYPTISTFHDEFFGQALRYLIYILFSIPVVIIYYLNKFPKFILTISILGVMLLLVLSIFYSGTNYIYSFFAFLIPMLWIYNKAFYLKNESKKSKYLNFQGKRMSLCTIPILVLTLIIQLIPTNYKNEYVVNTVDNLINNAMANMGVYGRQFSEIFNQDLEEIVLGGDSIKFGTVHFEIKNSEPLLLKTNVYDEYTGRSFIQSDIAKIINNETIEATDFIKTLDPELGLTDPNVNSYTLKMHSYFSNRVPNGVSYPSPTFVYPGGYFSINSSGELFSDKYFIKGDEILVEYRVNEFNDSYFGNNEYFDEETSSNIQYSNYELLTQLPDTITQRTKDLAENLKANLLNADYEHLDSNSFVQKYSFARPSETNGYKENVDDIYLNNLQNHMYYYLDQMILEEFTQIVNPFENLTKEQRLEYFKRTSYDYSLKEILKFFNYYLYETYEYTRTPDGGIGEDFVDSFLFDIEEGYCASFAAAMVVLLRSIGVPCRYVTGYSVYEVSEDTYQNVLDENLHAWVEVLYWTGEWVIVDPTNNYIDFGESDDYIVGGNADDVWKEIYDKAIDELNGISEETETQPNTQVETQLTQPTNPTGDTTATSSQGGTSSTQPTTTTTTQINLSIDIMKILPYIVFTLLFIGMILFLILHKRYTIKKVLSSKDKVVVYKSMIMFLSMLKIKKSDDETIREFLLRVFALDFAFKTNYTFDVNKSAKGELNHNEKEMEDIIHIVEKSIYSKQNDLDNIDSLISFRNKINTYVKENKNKILYFIKFRNIK